MINSTRPIRSLRFKHLQRLREDPEGIDQISIKTNIQMPSQETKLQLTGNANPAMRLHLQVNSLGKLKPLVISERNLHNVCGELQSHGTLPANKVQTQ